MAGDDRDWFESFQALRREEEGRVPAMSNLSLREHRPGRRQFAGKLAAAAVCLATVILGAVGLLSRVPHAGSNREREQANASRPSSITTWKPATNFLLDTPGRALLEGVPDIGEWPRGAIAPAHRNRFKKLP